jgi:hypothetical protein
MRRILTLSVMAVLALSSVSAAGDNSVPVQTASTSVKEVPVVQVSQSRGVFRPVRRSGGSGVLNRIMELERRKNAWLRRTFMN